MRAKYNNKYYGQMISNYSTILTKNLPLQKKFFD